MRISGNLLCRSPSVSASAGRSVGNTLNASGVSKHRSSHAAGGPPRAGRSVRANPFPGPRQSGSPGLLRALRVDFVTDNSSCGPVFDGSADRL